LVEAELEAVDRACSRFRSDSELNRVNDSGGSWVEISPLFVVALDAALRVARATGGAVDPTVGGALKVIGYDRDFDAVVASDDPIVLHAARVPGWTAIELDVRGRRVRLTREAELDLGSTAKAFAADRAASVAAQVGDWSGVLVSLGGDIALGGLAPRGGWLVAVAEDHRESSEGETELVAVTSGGIATSSTQVRRWTRAGVEYHHIIHPATGLPADGPWRTATVAAATCLEANGAATAAIVMGAVAQEWLERSGLPARLVATDGKILRLPGWPSSSE
jgi:thiamine biosynthesis lipoprotein